MATTDRGTFLAEVRRALAVGGRGESSSPPPPVQATKAAEESAKAAEESAFENLADQFAREAQAAEAEVLRVSSLAEAREAVRELLKKLGAERIVQGDTDGLRALDAAGDGLELTSIRLDEFGQNDLRVAIAAAEVGLTEAEYGVAESGTLVLLHRPGEGRAISLLPPVHVAVVRAADLLPDLAALFRRLATDPGYPASAVTLITGPSRTGDIEFVITKGVHGPREVHIVLVEED